MKKNLKFVAIATAVSILSVNAFGSGIPFYAAGSRQETPEEEAAQGSIENLGDAAFQISDGEPGSGDAQSTAEDPGDGAIQNDKEDSASAASPNVDGEEEGGAAEGSDGKEEGGAAQGSEEDSGDKAIQEPESAASPNVDGEEEVDAAEDSDGEKEGVLSKEAQAEDSFLKMIEEYDMYAMLANGEEFPIYAMPSEAASVQHTLPSGYQVKLTRAVIEESGLWYQIEYGVQDITYSGYVSDRHIVTQDARLQEWKAQAQNAYGMRSSARAAAGNTDLSAFPKSYQSYIKKLAAAHPNWTFVPMNTGLDWNEVLENESKPKVNLVDNSDSATCVTWKSTDPDSYDISTGKWKIKEGNTWVQASESIIKYYLDPRNFLNEDSVFQFEQLTYNGSYHTESGVEKVLSGTFMSHKKLEDGSEGGITYAQAFMKIGKELKVSPFFLASRVRQEQGVSGNSPLISGTYPGYKGYYNYFNRQATGIGEEVIINGLKEAKSKGWNTRYKALKGGAESVSADYISKGQDTFYLQKFDVDPSYNGLYWHQYMQNLLAADHEGKSVRKSYAEMGTIDNSFVFKVPVYNNMPSAACGKPGDSLAKPALSASKSGDSAVKLSWKEVPGAEAYQIFRAEKDGKYSRIKTVKGLSNTSYKDAKIEWGKVYSYKIRAYLKLYGGNLRSSNSAEKTVDFRIAKPQWKSVKLKDYATVTLSWEAENVTGYRIYRKTDNGSYKTLKTIKASSQTSFQDTAILPGHTYSYRMRCYSKKNGKSYFSYYGKVKEVQVKMPAPTLSKAAVSGGAKIKLSWVQDPKAQGYQIYRATSPQGKFVRIKSLSGNTPKSWSDANVAEGNSYYYKIRTYVKTSQGTKTSGFSQTLSVSTDLQKPDLSSARGVSKGIKLTWKKAKNAAGYKVYRASSPKGAYKQVKRIASNATISWTDKNVSKGKTYYYKVKSFALYGGKGKHSGFSNPQSAKC